MLSHAGAGAAVLAGAFVCFAFGWIGGGDAKLAAVTALWLGFGHLADYLVYASLLGGVLTIVIIQFRALPLPQLFSGGNGRNGCTASTAAFLTVLRSRRRRSWFIRIPNGCARPGFESQDAPRGSTSD